jgi:hypothetical protein
LIHPEITADHILLMHQDAKGQFAQRTGKAPVFQNPFLAGEGPANVGDMTMQTMGEWDWGELATE